MISNYKEQKAIDTLKNHDIIYNIEESQKMSSMSFLRTALSVPCTRLICGLRASHTALPACGSDDAAPRR